MKNMNYFFRTITTIVPVDMKQMQQCIQHVEKLHVITVAIVDYYRYCIKFVCLNQPHKKIF